MSAFEIRAATESDLRFVLSSWLASYRGAHAAGMIQMTDWVTVMSPQVDAVLSRVGVTVLVAGHPTAEPGTADVYGWIAAEHQGGTIPLIHYCYVKHAYRRRGFARRLLQALRLSATDEIEYTCKTAVISKLKAKMPRARWQPLRARYPEIVRDTHEQEQHEKAIH
jgi:GNAT superfamily N-acetyltransferase